MCTWTTFTNTWTYCKQNWNESRRKNSFEVYTQNWTGPQKYDNGKQHLPHGLGVNLKDDRVKLEILWKSTAFPLQMQKITSGKSASTRSSQLILHIGLQHNSLNFSRFVQNLPRMLPNFTWRKAQNGRLTYVTFAGMFFTHYHALTAVRSSFFRDDYIIQKTHMLKMLVPKRDISSWG